jgi:hypothetical protein
MIVSNLLKFWSPQSRHSVNLLLNPTPHPVHGLVPPPFRSRARWMPQYSSIQLLPHRSVEPRRSQPQLFSPFMLPSDILTINMSLMDISNGTLIVKLSCGAPAHCGKATPTSTGQGRGPPARMTIRRAWARRGTLPVTNLCRCPRVPTARMGHLNGPDLKPAFTHYFPSTHWAY